MDESTKRAREARAMVADFFNANPGQQYLCMGGAIHTSDGRMRRYGSTTLTLPPEMTAAEAHQIAQERGQQLYLAPGGKVMCADTGAPGAVRVRVTVKPPASRTPPPTEPTATPRPRPELPDTP